MSKTKCHPKFYQAICSTLTCQWMTIKVMILIVEKGSSQKDTNYFWSLPYTNFLLCDKKKFHEGSWNKSSYNARHIQIMTRGGAEGNHSVTLAPFRLAVSLIMSIFWAAGHWQREGEGWEGEKHARQLFSSSCDPGLRSSRCLHLLPDFATEPSASLSLSLLNEQVDKKTDVIKLIGT